MVKCGKRDQQPGRKEESKIEGTMMDMDLNTAHINNDHHSNERRL